MLVSGDRCAAWETEMKTNIDVSEENEALLLQKDLHMTGEIWSSTTQFLYCCPQRSEDPIPVKLALMAEKPKLHKANFLQYYNRNLSCLREPAVLKPKRFSPSRAFQLRSATSVRQQEHHIRATCSSRKPSLTHVASGGSGKAP